ncbi:S1 family peptidase [Amycolatopsis lurida]|uniref:S1 family peptidase n=1 Tax=Amycolatopsis lurida TaxID=31959 RepID=UPI000AF261C9|nr:trypsin-like serine protease [Amycolatopsis lurida]
MKYARRIATTAAAMTLTPLLFVYPAMAVSGSTPATYAFAAKVTMEGRACSGSLVSPNWIVTAADCFPENPQGGVPAKATTVVVGRPDLTTTTGLVTQVTSLVRRPDRNLMLAKLASTATGTAPVEIGAAPTAGETIRVAGFGRTKTEWVPNLLHSGPFSVESLTPTTVMLTGDSDTCLGDAGGPAIRETAGKAELVGVSSASWQHGCLGVTESRRGSTGTRVDDLGPWLKQITQITDVSLSDSRVARLQNGSAYLLDGGTWTLQWEAQYGTVAKLRVDGTRIGVLLSTGDLWVKDDTEPATGWFRERDAVTDFALSGSRIAILSGGSAYLKDGDLKAPWTTQWDARYGAATAIGIDGGRVGVLTADRHLLVKDDAVPAGWTDLSDATTAFDLSGNRVTALRDGFVQLKEGGLDAGWTTQWDPQYGKVSKLDIAGTRLGVLLDTGVLWAKDDASPNQPWTAQAAGVTTFGLGAKRIVVLQDGQALLKAGGFEAAWTNLGQ